MRWITSISPSFQARHEAARAAEAGELLERLELTRSRLIDYFPRPLDGITVVLHGSPWSLWLARPPAVLGWAATAPAARRYHAGWVAGEELHVLSPRSEERRVG